jgi:tripartite-type tricarboxylate transporter receptor subunit TctC
MVQRRALSDDSSARLGHSLDSVIEESTMKTRFTLTRRSFMTATAVVLLADRLRSQPGGTFPDRPLRLIVPATPGGVQDVQARRLLPKLTENLRQQVIVDNRPGAAGSIAMEHLVRSAPDGYTMALAPINIAITPHLTKVPYDPLKDMIAVSKVTSGPEVLVAHPSAPFSNLEEMIGHARRRGGLAIAGFGTGGLAHLTVALLSRVTGVPFTHLPYSGGGQQVTDLIGGQIELLLDYAAVLKQHLSTGKMKALGVTAERRLAVLPDVPTFEEQGIAEMRILAWQGVVVPAGTPDAVVRRLNAALVSAMNDPEVRAGYTDHGSEVGADSPESFAAYIRAEYKRWGDLIRDANIKVE